MFRDPRKKNASRLGKELKVAWAASLSALVGMLLLMEANGETALRPVVNTLIDFLQEQRCSPAGGEIPTSPGPLDFPPGQKVPPAAEDPLAGGARQVAPR